MSGVARAKTELWSVTIYPLSKHLWIEKTFYHLIAATWTYPSFASAKTIKLIAGQYMPRDVALRHSAVEKILMGPIMLQNIRECKIDVDFFHHFPKGLHPMNGDFAWGFSFQVFSVQ